MNGDTQLDFSKAQPIQAQSDLDFSRAEPIMPSVPPSHEPIDFDRLGMALVNSHMTSMPVSLAYKNHDQVHEELAKRGVDAPKSTNTISKDIKVGSERSIFGLAYRNKLPEALQSPSRMDDIISGLSQMVSDLPVYIASSMIGGAAGGAVGSEIPGVGNVAGAIGGSAMGTFAIPEAIRKSLVLGIEKGDIKSFGDLIDRTIDTFYAGEKGALTGLVTHGVGMGTLPTKALGPASDVAQVALKRAQQGAALGLLPPLLEGQVPNAEDFVTSTALVTTLGLVAEGTPIVVKQGLMDVYAKNGTLPKESAIKLQAQPPVKPEMKQGLQPAIRLTINGTKQVITGDDATHSDLSERVQGVRPISIEELNADPKLADKVLGNHEPQVQQVIDRAYEIKAESGETDMFPPELKSGRGFAVVKGDSIIAYLNRKQGENWVKANEPDVHEMWKQEHPENGAEFHTEDYKSARDRVASRNLIEGEDSFGILSPLNLRRLAAARVDLNAIRNGDTSKGYARKAMRTLWTGQKDIRVAATREMYDDIAKLLPSKGEGYRNQEALSFYRDYKGNPEKLKAKIDSVEASGSDAQKAFNSSRQIALDALNGKATPEFLESDRKLTEYFTWANDEARQFHLFNSSIPPDRYNPHLFTPMLEDELETVTAGAGDVGRAGFTKRTPHGIKRTYQTTDEALDTGRIDAKTVNALESLVEYGDKHSSAVATSLLLTEFKNSALGGSGNKGDFPADWQRIAPHLPEFNKTIVIPDPETGGTRVMSQGFYAPKIVAQAMRPIVTPDVISGVPYFRQIALAQAFTKVMEFGFSVFHLKSEGLMMMNNTRYTDYMKGMKNDITPEDVKEWAADGVKTSAAQIPYEYWGELKKSSIPTGFDKFREAPVISQIDKGAHAITSVIFDTVLPKFKITSASMQLAAWMADPKHANATDQEYFAARRQIAQQVNSVYGNLNWEVMGWDKNALKLARVVLLAPDWFFSNVAGTKYAFEGGVSGSNARWFMFRSFATGLAMNQAASLMFSPAHELSEHVTEVYLGEDKDKKKVYANWFFAGLPKDTITFLNSIKRNAPEAGVIQFLSYKLGPLTGTAYRVATNKDWRGRPIYKQKDTFLEKFGKQTEFTAGALVPFSFESLHDPIKEMINDPKHQYTYQQILEALSAFTGSTVKHEGPPEKQGTHVALPGSTSGRGGKFVVRKHQ